jgi:hypothetical protein
MRRILDFLTGIFMSDSGDVVRRITIIATGEGLDSTTSAVNDLGDAFDNAQKKADGSAFNGAVLAIAGMGAAVVGAIAGTPERGLQPP